MSFFFVASFALSNFILVPFTPREQKHVLRTFANVLIYNPAMKMLFLNVL